VRFKVWRFPPFCGRWMREVWVEVQIQEEELRSGHGVQLEVQTLQPFVVHGKVPPEAVEARRR